MIAGMVTNFADELSEAGVHGPQLVAQGCRFLPELGAIAQTVLGGWAGSVKQGT